MPSRPQVLLAAVLAGAALTLGLWLAREAPATAAPMPAAPFFVDRDAGVRVVTVATGLDHPWSLAFLPDGSRLVTEKSGTLRRIGARGAVSAPLSGVPEVDPRGQGGLLEVAVDPDFAANRFIYLSYVEPHTDGGNGIAVARGMLAADNQALTGLRVIFRQQPTVRSTAHFGGRLAFAADGMLFVTLGDRQADRERGKAQHLDKHHGKIVRIARDGSVPAGNPFAGRRDARPEIWSLGHRNVQGAAIHPRTGELWISEHGPQGGDEINVAKKGRNYGWPVITYGCEYGGCRPIGEGTHREGMEQPLTWWVPVSTAPSGLAFYTGDRFPAWRGNLFSGSLAGKTLWRIELDGEHVLARHALLTGLGERLRDVRQGPDGFLYLLTDSPQGRLLRVEPLAADAR
ncbi:MAG: PQQ-dependent sugar dehydrogenase [Pseudomonadota bacterium]